MHSNATGNIEVIPKVPTEIVVSNVAAHPGDDVSIRVNVTAGDGLQFNGNVSFTLPDNNTVPVEIVDGSGVVNWTVPYGYEGEYPTNASFEGDNYYMSSNGTGIVTVELIPTHISADNNTVYPGSNLVSSVNVTLDDGTLFNGPVDVTLPDGTNTTIEIVNGTGNITFTVPMDYDQEYNFIISFAGDGKYAPSEAEFTVTVQKIPIKTMVGNVTGHPRDTVTIPVNVTADNGVPFNGEVNVTLPDGTVELVSIVNGSGSVNWTIPDGSEGQYPVNDSFNGNKTHSAAAATV